MKKIFMLLVAIAAMVFVSCSKDDDTDPLDTGENGVITMTVDEEYVNFEVGTAKVGEIITIDWGDGQTQEYKSVKVVDDEEIWHGIEAEHTYSQTSTHAIKVSGALTELDCAYNKLISLDVSKNTALVVLYCGANELTSLDVSKCTALTRLVCYRNQLTSKALNKIFTDLPKGKLIEDSDYDQSYIDISDNPGSETCNKSIAENKGWKVSTTWYLQSLK